MNRPRDLDRHISSHLQAAGGGIRIPTISHEEREALRKRTDRSGVSRCKRVLEAEAAQSGIPKKE